MLAVLAGMVFASVLSPAMAYAANPHVPAAVSASSCPQCHDPHQAAVGENILRTTGTIEGDPDAVKFCYACHDGSSAVNVKTGMNNAAFDGASGHSVEAADVGGDLTNICADCHDPHADSTTEFRLPQQTINGNPVDGADNTWCFACHDDAQSWWTSVASGRTTAQYTAFMPAPSRNTTGYPTTGTFPGETVYRSATNAHANIPAGSMDDWVMASREATRVAGDCLWCHSGHRGKSEYDGLVDTFGAPKDPVGAADLVDGDYTAVCLRCHSATLAAGITFDTAAEVPNVADSVLADTAAPESFNGHRVRTSGGDLPVNSPLPCYLCHNPHGSTRNNSTLFSDTLGANLDTSTDAGMRAFCFTCHTTYDETAEGLPYGWDSVAATYTPVGAADEVAGLPRAADETTKANKLRLWQIARPGHSKDDTQNCITCHLDVHAPMGSVSMGNMECLECHEPMLPMVPGNTGSTDTYHHVLNAENPDAVPGDDPYCVFPENPETQPWALSCVSCHVDHNKYESANASTPDPTKVPGKAFNLRHSARSSDPVASNTDEGLCLSCHSYTLQGRIYRSTDDTTVPGITAVPAGQADNALYATAVMRVEDDMWGYEPDPTDPLVNLVPESERSPHNYTADGVFDDGSAFKANCAKCHGTLDDATLSYSEPAFTVHFSAEQRLLNALGQDRSSLTLPQTAAINEEDMCFRCHSNSTDKLGASTHDYYGGRFMGVASRVIGTQMSGNPFGHKPAIYDKRHRISSIDEPQEYLGTVVGGVAVNKHVECADCHNHHVVGDSRHVYGTDNRVSDAIKGVRGVGLKTTSTVLQKLAAANWPTADPISYGSGVNDELEYKQMATYEYEICFKCHSSANADASGNVALPAWGGPMVWTVWPGQTEGKNLGVNNWTNVAQDFNVGNNSRHPVLATLSGYYYPTAEATSMVLWPGYPLTDTPAGRTSSLAVNQVSNGWGPGDTMMCSDCHGDSDAPIAMVWNGTAWVPNPLAEDVPQGPHGSSIRFSLRGPGTDWPVRTDLATPRLITLADLNDSTYASTVFCSNCHPASVTVNNKAHMPARGTQHLACTCVSCHVLVPHGGKMSRLVADASTGVGSMPTRLAYQGNKANVGILSFKKRIDATDYTSGDCAVTGTACAKGQHTRAGGFTTNQTGGTWENWEPTP